MRTNDLYFKPGDKVMRVDSITGPNSAVKPTAGAPKFGQIYCVEDFFEGPEFNVVMLVGFGGWLYSFNGTPIGWRAVNFRKVEEIKLCVAATQKNTAQVEATIP